MARHRWGQLLALCLLTILIAAGGCPVRTYARDSIDVAPTDTLVQRLMAMYRVPGAALALIKGGRIVFEKGYGYRDLAARAPVTADTLFNLRRTPPQIRCRSVPAND